MTDHTLIQCHTTQSHYTVTLPTMKGHTSQSHYTVTLPTMKGHTTQSHYTVTMPKVNPQTAYLILQVSLVYTKSGEGEKRKSGEIE